MAGVGAEARVPTGAEAGGGLSVRDAFVALLVVYSSTSI